MAHKYVPPKKKKHTSVASARTKLPVQAPIDAAPEIAVSYATTAKAAPAPAPGIIPDNVLFSSLPKELIRLGVLSAVAIAIMVILYFILR